MRYVGEHRGEIKIETDNKEAAVSWLGDLSSIAATVTDRQTGDVLSVNASGEIITKGRRAGTTPLRAFGGVIRQTHTYAILDVSKAVYDEIQKKLTDASYTHAFHQTDSGTVIDMHGIALRQE